MWLLYIYTCIIIIPESVHSLHRLPFKTMEAKKETVICVHSVNTVHFLSYIEAENNKKESPFYYKLYCIPITNEEEISKCIKYVRKMGKECVLSVGDASSYACAIVNERLGYPSPSPLSNVVCRDKYQTRKFVRDFEWYYGFNLGDPVDLVVQNVKTFPCMLKPTMLFGSRGVSRCYNESSLRSKLQDINADEDTLEHIRGLHSELEMLPILGENVAGKNMHYNMMVEECIETNGTGIYEYDMDVLVTREGKVIPYSLFEAALFQDGTILGFLSPPIHFDGGIKPFEDYAIHIGDKLFSIGFNNQAFNVQFWRYPDGMFRLVEINPRFTTAVHAYEQYSGNSVYTDVANLFLHNREPVYTPLSVFKERLNTNTYEELYVINVDFLSRSVGLVSSLFNYDLLDELAANGYAIVPHLDRAEVATVGKCFASLTISGTWNEIVEEEKSLRKQLLRLPKDSECFEYPNYFTFR